jgi:glycosyltransferase involved in cell wall biosynthesis
MNLPDSNIIGVENTVQRPSLSLCIPTYNRPTQLKRVLESVIPQIAPGVEIVICDNSAARATEAMIQEYLRYE